MAKFFPKFRPSGSESRLILPFFPSRFFGTSKGLKRDAISSVPEPLLKRGVTQAVWDEYVRDKLQKVQAKNVSISTHVLAWMCTAGLSMMYLGRSYQRHLRAWLDEFNEEVLLKRGMMAKTQTKVVIVGKSRVELSWLAISLTPQDAKLLRAEKHMIAARFSFLFPCDKYRVV